MRASRGNRLKNDPTKLGIQNKRLKAGWDERHLAKLFFRGTAPAKQTQLISCRRVATGDCSPVAPTDPDVPNSGIRLLGLDVRYVA